MVHAEPEHQRDRLVAWLGARGSHGELLMAPADHNPPLVTPPGTAIDIGGGHMIEYVDYQGEPAGINDWHRTKTRSWCRGWVSFNGSAWRKSGGWDVVQRDPLTLSPS